MREIKFRAWNTHTLTYDSYPYRTRVNEMAYFGLFDLDENYICSSGTCIDDETIIMQYIGLKDKNGKEIYEGDIVIVKGDYSGHIFYNDCIAVIEYDTNEFTPVNKKDKYGLVRQDYTWEEFEVIGNIYENENLIDKEEIENE